MVLKLFGQLTRVVVGYSVRDVIGNVSSVFVANSITA